MNQKYELSDYGKEMDKKNGGINPKCIFCNNESEGFLSHAFHVLNKHCICPNGKIDRENCIIHKKER